ncbi:unnamed protein product [Paramecium pentaurelia]|uniref:Uncharacterized protein n=1 Tax=Paramecium pentaurelia TaxID=43138 RepID=A0A8S1USL4_9CILI|nr:unnamed protein product [Paramecium pentaurelia]
MYWLEYLFDAKILIGFGVGVLTASLSLIPTLREHNQENAQSQMKLSNKSIPSTKDLKQVYIKTDSSSKERKKNNQNSDLTELNKQDFYFNLDNGIRKKIKVQKTDEDSSPKDHQSSQSFNDDEDSQNFIELNNINNKNENNQSIKDNLEVPSSSSQQGSQLNKKIVSEPQDEQKQNSNFAVGKGREQEGEEI